MSGQNELSGSEVPAYVGIEGRPKLVQRAREHDECAKNARVERQTSPFDGRRTSDCYCGHGRRLNAGAAGEVTPWYQSLA